MISTFDTAVPQQVKEDNSRSGSEIVPLDETDCC